MDQVQSRNLERSEGGSLRQARGGRKTQTDGQRWKDRRPDKQGGRQTNKQTDRQTEAAAVAETDREVFTLLDNRLHSLRLRCLIIPLHDRPHCPDALPEAPWRRPCGGQGVVRPRPEVRALDQFPSLHLLPWYFPGNNSLLRVPCLLSESCPCDIAASERLRTLPVRPRAPAAASMTRERGQLRRPGQRVPVASQLRLSGCTPRSTTATLLQTCRGMTAERWRRHCEGALKTLLVSCGSCLGVGRGGAGRPTAAFCGDSFVWCRWKGNKGGRGRR